MESQREKFGKLSLSSSINLSICKGDDGTTLVKIMLATHSVRLQSSSDSEFFEEMAAK